MHKLLFALAFGLLLSVTARAQTWVGGTGTNVTTAANWNPSATPANNGTATLSFGTTANTSVNFDTAYSLSSLAFSGSAGYSLSGSALTLGSSGINDSATVSQFINNALTLAGSATFATTAGVAGSNLTINATINNAGNNLTLSTSGGALSVLGNISGAGSLVAAGSAVTFLSGAGNTWSGGTTINSGATLEIGDPGGSSSGSLPGDVTDNGTLNFKPGAAGYTYGGVISGSGTIQTLGTHMLTLTGINSYTGTTLVNQGTLQIGADNTLPIATTLNVTGPNMFNGMIAAVLDVAHNQTVDHFGSTSSGGSIVIESGKTLTISPAAAISSTFNGTISDGTIPGGILVIAGNSTATTVLKSSSTFTGGTTVQSGTLELDNTSGSGLGTGPVTIDSGAQLVGKANTFAGFTGTLSLSGTMRPSGTLAAGATTINPGARYTWLLTDTAGAAGTTYGLLNVTGSLTLAATVGNPFVIAPTTFIAGTGPGAAANFDTTQNYSFTLATSTLGVSGFNPSAFAFDMSGFQNVYTGTWSVATSLDGDNLLLNYTGGSAIPEPAVSALLVGWCGLGVVLWRKRGQARQG